MNIYVWSGFSKRTNSTKQPTGGTQVTVTLKEPCTVENPVFILSYTGTVPDYNYVQAFGRYYFVTDITVLDGHRIEIRCSVDVLATYKSSISGYTAFVERASSDYNEFIPDILLSGKQNIVDADIANTGLGLNKSGIYLMRVTNDEGLSQYAFTDKALISFLYNEGAYGYQTGEIENIIKSVGLAIMNVADYIINCMWLPLSVADLDTDTEAVKLGFWEFNGITAPKVTNDHLYVTGITLAMPDNYYSDFRAAHPSYSRYSLTLPGVGEVALDPIDAFHDTIEIDYAIDLWNGSVTYSLRDSTSSKIISRYRGQLGIQIPIGGMTMDVGSIVESMLGMASQGPAAIGSIGGFAGNVYNTVMSPQISYNSSSGNLADLQIAVNAKVSLTNYDSAEFPLNEAGRPLCENVLLSTLSGYVKCGNASVPIAAHDAEINAVNDFLNNGFYLE